MNVKKPDEIVANVLFDGQNLFHGARDAFGCSQPNYDVMLLAQAACKAKGWRLGKVSFYSGIPPKSVQPALRFFWNKKLAAMQQQGVQVNTTELRYSDKAEYQADGSTKITPHAREKGIDMWIGLDIFEHAVDASCNAIIVFSQDNDLQIACKRASMAAARMNHHLDIACAFPSLQESGDNEARSKSSKGIVGIDWIHIDRDTYFACRDRNSYGLTASEKAYCDKVTPFETVASRRQARIK